jgi:hypothetical protein
MYSYSSAGSRQYDSDRENYTMGLRNDKDTTICEGIAITEILNDIAKIVANGGSSSGGGYGTTISERVRHINDLFEDHGEYKYTWTVDETYKQLIGKSSYCTLTINLNELDYIYYTTKSSSTNPSGLQIHSDSKGIREQCGSGDDYIDNKYYYLDSESYARDVISEMLAIKQQVLE